MRAQQWSYKGVFYIAAIPLVPNQEEWMDLRNEPKVFTAWIVSAQLIQGTCSLSLVSFFYIAHHHSI